MENIFNRMTAFRVDLDKWSSTTVHGLEDNNFLQSDLQKYFLNYLVYRLPRGLAHLLIEEIRCVAWDFTFVTSRQGILMLLVLELHWLPKVDRVNETPLGSEQSPPPPHLSIPLVMWLVQFSAYDLSHFLYYPFFLPMDYFEVKLDIA